MSMPMGQTTCLVSPRYNHRGAYTCSCQQLGSYKYRYTIPTTATHDLGYRRRTHASPDDTLGRECSMWLCPFRTAQARSIGGFAYISKEASWARLPNMMTEPTPHGVTHEKHRPVSLSRWLVVGRVYHSLHKDPPGRGQHVFYDTDTAVTTPCPVC